MSDQEQQLTPEQLAMVARAQRDQMVTMYGLFGLVVLIYSSPCIALGLLYYFLTR